MGGAGPGLALSSRRAAKCVCLRSCVRRKNSSFADVLKRHKLLPRVFLPAEIASKLMESP